VEKANSAASELKVDPAEPEIHAYVQKMLEIPLSAPWTQCVDAKGKAFYWNGLTGASSWEHPFHQTHVLLAAAFRKVVASVDPAKAGQAELQAMRRKGEDELMQWREVEADGGRCYYYHVESKLTTWENPRDVLTSRLALQAEMMSHVVKAETEKRSFGNVLHAEAEPPVKGPGTPRAPMTPQGSQTPRPPPTPEVMGSTMGHTPLETSGSQTIISQTIMGASRTVHYEAVPQRPRAPATPEAVGSTMGHTPLEALGSKTMVGESTPEVSSVLQSTEPLGSGGKLQRSVKAPTLETPRYTESSWMPSVLPSTEREFEKNTVYRLQEALLPSVNQEPSLEIKLERVSSEGASMASIEEYLEGIEEFLEKAEGNNEEISGSEDEAVAALTAVKEAENRAIFAAVQEKVPAGSQAVPGEIVTGGAKKAHEVAAAEAAVAEAEVRANAFVIQKVEEKTAAKAAAKEAHEMADEEEAAAQEAEERAKALAASEVVTETAVGTQEMVAAENVVKQAEEGAKAVAAKEAEEKTMLELETKKAKEMAAAAEAAATEAEERAKAAAAEEAEKKTVAEAAAKLAKEAQELASAAEAAVREAEETARVAAAEEVEEKAAAEATSKEVQTLVAAEAAAQEVERQNKAAAANEAKAAELAAKQALEKATAEVASQEAAETAKAAAAKEAEGKTMAEAAAKAAQQLALAAEDAAKQAEEEVKAVAAKVAEAAQVTAMEEREKAITEAKEAAERAKAVAAKEAGEKSSAEVSAKKVHKMSVTSEMAAEEIDESLIVAKAEEVDGKTGAGPTSKDVQKMAAADAAVVKELEESTKEVQQAFMQKRARSAAAKAEAAAKVAEQKLDEKGKVAEEAPKEEVKAAAKEAEKQTAAEATPKEVLQRSRRAARARGEGVASAHWTSAAASDEPLPKELAIDKGLPISSAAAVDADDFIHGLSRASNGFERLLQMAKSRLEPSATATESVYEPEPAPAEPEPIPGPEVTSLHFDALVKRPERVPLARPAVPAPLSHPVSNHHDGLKEAKKLTVANETLVKKDVNKHEFSISVDKTYGLELGVDANFGDATSILVESVKDGLISSWNDSNPHRKVQPGDRFVEVNRLRGDGRRMVEEIRSAQTLTITVQRQDQLPQETPHRRPRRLQASGVKPGEVAKRPDEPASATSWVTETLQAMECQTTPMKNSRQQESTSPQARGKGPSVHLSADNASYAVKTLSKHAAKARELKKVMKEQHSQVYRAYSNTFGLADVAGAASNSSKHTASVSGAQRKSASRQAHPSLARSTLARAGSSISRSAPLLA